jgi:hypothetical protein
MAGRLFGRLNLIPIALRIPVLMRRGLDASYTFPVFRFQAS